MISEEQQDQAALYALELLGADEAAAFERGLAADGGLRALAAEFREAAASLARTDTGDTAPPAGLKEKVLARVAAEASGGGHPVAGKVVAGPWNRWLPQAAAAVLLATCGGLLWSTLDSHRRYREAAEAEQSVRWQLRGLEERLREAQANRLQQVTFCALEPVPAAQGIGPQAAVLWDAAGRRGRLQLHKLPPPGTGKDYQLWTVEAGHKNPVSAGVVKLDADGGATVDFRPGEGDDEKAAVAAFALSVERAGGVASNEGPILFLGKLPP